MRATFGVVGSKPQSPVTGVPPRVRLRTEHDAKRATRSRPPPSPWPLVLVPVQARPARRRASFTARAHFPVPAVRASRWQRIPRRKGLPQAGHGAHFDPSRPTERATVNLRALAMISRRRALGNGRRLAGRDEQWPVAATPPHQAAEKNDRLLRKTSATDR